uniref:Uncharacterized protein n=1 Tax=Leersia perrieri TaxID=77586 RepID=A0A0D9XYE1_9ORYZ
MPSGQSRAHRLGHIDGNWPEVLLINDYAVFMGYLSMAVTGTGFLVLTWSTVVLLGGFVSMLSNKDFWSLTVITLVQTRIFDIFLNGKISHIGYSLKRLCKAARFIALPHNHKKVGFRGAVRVVVFTIVLCPLFLLYMFGLFVSPWISLCRLIWQDYGKTAGDSSKAHLRPALLVLYSLALFQGVLFYYRAISGWEEHKLVKDVADKYGFDTVSSVSILDYLHEIKVGCEKDPSFARGRNLITYAAQLMESTSPDRYLSGARILDTLIQFNWGPSGCEFPGQSMLIHNTIGSASSGSILHNLVQMLDSRNPYDREIRLHAAMIVVHFASDIRLDKIQQGIQCISSLLDARPFYQQDKPLEYGHHISVKEERSVKEEDLHKQLQLAGMQIIFKLSDDESNLRVMSNTYDLALKIVALTNNLKLHDQNHGEWYCQIAEPGVKLLGLFMSVNTRSNNILRHEILTSRDAVNTLENILGCDQCDDVLKKPAIRVLTQICMDISSVMGDESRERFIHFLTNMFLHKSKGPLFEELAGEELAQLSLRSESGSAIILKIYGSTVVDCVAETRSGVHRRKIAADILKHLFRNYSTDDEHFQNLKEAMIDLMPKEYELMSQVLIEVLNWELTRKKIHRVPPQSNVTSTPTPALDSDSDSDHIKFHSDSDSDSGCLTEKIKLDTDVQVTLSQSRNLAPIYIQPTTEGSWYSHHQYPYYGMHHPGQDYYISPPGTGLDATQHDDRTLKEALASLCATVYRKMVITDAELTDRFDNIAADICYQAAKPCMTFAGLIKEAEKVAETMLRPPYYPPPPPMIIMDEPSECCIC